MSEHDDDDDGSLKPLRAVWLSMRDEEPPADGMAALLAAARVKADEMKARPTAWQRFVGALRRPPVLALAGVAVLISGAIVLGNRHDEMRAPTEPAAPALERAPAPVPSLPEPPGEAGSAAPASTSTIEAPPPPPPSKPSRPARKAASKPKPATEPPPVTTEALHDEATAEQDAGARVTAKTPTTAPSPPVAGARKLEQATEAAAARGDCPDVKRNARALSRTDRPAYDALVQRNAAVARCLRQ